MLKATTLIGAAAAIALFGGVAPANAATAPPTQPTTSQQEAPPQTIVLDPTHSFAMTAKPSLKATPYWGEPKAG